MAVMNKKYGIAAVLMQAEADPECQMVDETASSDMETEVESKETGENRKKD